MTASHSQCAVSGSCTHACEITWFLCSDCLSFTVCCVIHAARMHVSSSGLYALTASHSQGAASGGRAHAGSGCWWQQPCFAGQASSVPVRHGDLPGKWFACPIIMSVVLVWLGGWVVGLMCASACECVRRFWCKCALGLLCLSVLMCSCVWADPWVWVWICVRWT